MKAFKFLNVIVIFALLLAAVPGMVADAAGTPVVSEGYDPLATIGGGVRYRNFSPTANNGDLEVMIGKGGFGGGPSQPYTTLNFFPWKATNGITFGYDKSLGKLSTTVVANATYTKDYPLGDLGSLNYVKIYLQCTQAGTSVNFNNVVLAGYPLGNFSCPTGGGKNWMVTGVDLSNGFSLTGDLVMGGPNACRECNKLEIWVGYSVPPDNEGPVTSDVVVTPSPACLNGSATVTATVDDTTTGGSNIASAQYSLNGGMWYPMMASDGSFNSVIEGVTAGFGTTTIGSNSICVKGIDALNNIGAQTCQSFVVNYDFTGFFQPIDNNAVNTARAGQAIPAKWRITDCAGNPIEDSGSFVALVSYPVSCTDFTGNPLDAVEEYASGESGLIYHGDGYWQFNWKTPKTYAGTCRAMYVEFAGGATSPTAKFQFK